MDVPSRRGEVNRATNARARGSRRRRRPRARGRRTTDDRSHARRSRRRVFGGAHVRVRRRVETRDARGVRRRIALLRGEDVGGREGENDVAGIGDVEPLVGEGCDFVDVASTSAVKAKAETKSSARRRRPSFSRSVRAVLANSRVSRSMRLNDHGGVTGDDVVGRAGAGGGGVRDVGVGVGDFGSRRRRARFRFRSRRRRRRCRGRANDEPSRRRRARTASCVSPIRATRRRFDDVAGESRPGVVRLGRDKAHGDRRPSNAPRCSPPWARPRRMVRRTRTRCFPPRPRRRRTRNHSRRTTVDAGW